MSTLSISDLHNFGLKVKIFEICCMFLKEAIHVFVPRDEKGKLNSFKYHKSELKPLY